MSTTKQHIHPSSRSMHKHPWTRRLSNVLVSVVLTYIILAYAITPRLWRHYEHHPALETAPKTTTTADGIPGDALNIGLVGDQNTVVHALLAAGWFPADRVTFDTSIRIAASVLLRRAYSTAPVSPLYLYGRVQDLAFEQPVGSSARQRHHLRLWRSDEFGKDGQPLWLGAATFDQSVGLSHTTGQITHHIAPDVDAERNGVMADLAKTNRVTETYQVTGVGATVSGRNGGGDWYYTDGEIDVAVLRADDSPIATTTVHLPSPAPVALKNRAWRSLRQLLHIVGL